MLTMTKTQALPQAGTLPAVATRPRRRLPITVTGTSPLTPDYGTLTSSLAWHLARRIGIAGTASLADEISAAGTDVWLEKQFNPASIDDSYCDGLIAQYQPMVNMTLSEMASFYLPYSFSGVPRANTSPMGAAALLLRGLWTKRHLSHAMELFWLDHFSVPFINLSKVLTAASPQIVRRLRPLAMTTFAEILTTTYALPAIHLYLDNVQNVAGGVNENLARETFELFTVGIDNFTETDVQQLAILLTGQAVGLGRYTIPESLTLTDSAHVFTPSVTIRGRSYPNATHDQVLTSMSRLLADLALDPLTARFVCTKLARRFVADQPPAWLVDSMVSAYLANGSGIVPVLRAMFTSTAFAESVGAKWRRPDELHLSLIKAHKPAFAWPNITDPQAVKDYVGLQRTRQWLTEAGMPFRGWTPPDGFPDTAAYWMSSGPLVKWVNHVDLIWLNVEWYPASDAGWTWSGSWAQALGVTGSMSYTTAADRLIERLTGYTAAPTLVRTEVRAALNGGTAPSSPDAPIGTAATVDLAVRTVLTSPLFFLR